MKKKYLLSVTVLVFPLLLWTLKQTESHDGIAAGLGVHTAAAQGAVEGVSMPETLNEILGPVVRPAQSESERRIASSLQKLGKNLILESTRGLKDVEVYRKAAPGVVFVLTEDGWGSGAVIDRSGHVITNWHVVKDREVVDLLFKPKDSVDLKRELAFRAEVEKVDGLSDLALLKIVDPPEGAVVLELGQVSDIEVGEDVHAIGHPEGEVWTYTKGVVSQIRPDYSWETPDKYTHRANIIQTQTPINPGNSGGPLIDDTGRIIGINSFFNPGQQGLNYAVAVDTVKQFLNRKQSRPALTHSVSSEPECTEFYDGTGLGWNNIVGCYYSASNPPPHFWVVAKRRSSPPSYMAFDTKMAGHIDKVVVIKDQNWQEFEHYTDTDCNGTVDLIGRQSKGEAGPSSFRIPQGHIYMKDLAAEVDSAIKSRKIPYQKLRVCQ